jgi:hypothetical protein
VLPGDDVLNMVDQVAVLLAESPIFATSARSSPDHVVIDCKTQVQARLEFENRDEIRRVDQRLVFGALRVADIALLGPLPEQIRPLAPAPS